MGQCNKPIPRLTATEPAVEGRDMAFTHWQFANESNFGFVVRITDGVQRMKTARPFFGRADQRDEIRRLGYRRGSQRKNPFVNFIEPNFGLSDCR